MIKINKMNIIVRFFSELNRFFIIVERNMFAIDDDDDNEWNNGEDNQQQGYQALLDPDDEE